jgi:hypothetical protein
VEKSGVNLKPRYLATFATAAVVVLALTFTLGKGIWSDKNQIEDDEIAERSRWRKTWTSLTPWIFSMIWICSSSSATKATTPPRKLVNEVRQRPDLGAGACCRATGCGSDQRPRNPDKEMLRMMELLKEMEMIKQLEMMRDLHRVDPVGDQMKTAKPAKQIPAKKETLK